MKNFKKVIAALLSFALIVGATFVTAGMKGADLGVASENILAAGEEAVDTLVTMMKANAEKETEANGRCNCGYDPVIVLPGINHSRAYLCDENGNPALDADGNVIEGNNIIVNAPYVKDVALKELPGPLLATLLTQHDAGLSKAAAKVVDAVVSVQKADNNGDTYNDIKVYRYDSMAKVSKSDYDWLNRMVPMQDLIDVVGKDHMYFFTFNLAGDPMDSADELDAYIQKVKRETGHDKVSLLSVSLGGTLFTAYVEKYKQKNDVSCAVNAVAVLNGTNIVEDFFNRNWNLSDDFLYNEFMPMFAEENMDSKALGYVFNFVLRLLPKQVLMNTLTAAYDPLYNQMLTKIPQFWAMISKEAYAKLAPALIGGEEYAVLKSRTDAYQQARINLESNMKYMIANGTRIHNICGYNLFSGDVQYNMFKIAASAQYVNSDSIIPIESTALGCTAVLPGQTITGHDGSKYLSPDKSVYAGTCVLPDSTWFFKDLHHEDAGNNAATMNLVKEILIDKDFKSVDYKPDIFPQFNYGTNNKVLRRWLLPDAKAVDQSTLSAEDKAELNAAIAEGEHVLTATIGDSAAVVAATDRLNAILVKIGVREPEKTPTKFDDILETIARICSDAMNKTVGGRGFSDVPKDAVKSIFS